MAQISKATVAGVLDVVAGITSLIGGISPLVLAFVAGGVLGAQLDPEFRAAG